MSGRLSEERWIAISSLCRSLDSACRCRKQAARWPGKKNTVLRNTYWLLALTMLPTIGGALLGTQMNLARVFAANPIMAPLIMFGVMMGGLFVVSALRNSAWGVAALFGFTFVAGVALTPILTYAAGFANGGQAVALAAGMTAVIFFALAGFATATKKDFSFMGSSCSSA